jgi:hypothetical protein
MLKFYRVCNNKTKQGLWYTQEGIHTGLIHNEFNFCTNSNLPMDFDPELTGWLSAVMNLEDLWKWFTKEDILQLQNHDFYIYEYEVTSHKFYNRFQHFVINQETSKPVKQIILLEEVFSEI